MEFIFKKIIVFLSFWSLSIQSSKTESVSCQVQEDCIIYNLNKNYEFYCTEYIANLIIFPVNRDVLKSSYQFKMNNCSMNLIYFANINGIDIDSQILIERKIVNYNFLNSDFNFIYKKGMKNLEQKFLANVSMISFEKGNRFRLNISSLIFKDSNIESLEINEIVNSKAIVNYFNFYDDCINLNANIKEFSLSMFHIQLDHTILSPSIFQNVEVLNLQDYFTISDSKLFEPFTNLNRLILRLYSLENFFHKGTSWMSRLNQNSRNKWEKMFIKFAQRIDYMHNFVEIQTYSYPDTDFCLFKDFPHDNNVFPEYIMCFDTCTFYWLFKRSIEHFTFDLKCENLLRSKTCNFERMRNACSLHVYLEKEYTDFFLLFDPNYEMKLYDYLLSIVIFPLVCALGIVFNLLNILTLRNKKYLMCFKERMYIQMIIKSEINLVICTIYFLRLFIKCIDPISNFCPPSYFITNRFLVYFILNSMNFIGSSLKTCSNLVHISIALDRLALIKNRNISFAQKYIKIDYKIVLIIQFVFSLVLNSVKLFQFEYNDIHNFDIYPQVRQEYFDFEFIYAYFNLFGIFITDFVVIMLQFFFDLKLIIFIKETVTNKKNMTSHGCYHEQHKHDKLERNTKLMVALSGIFLFVFHSPDFCVSVFMAFTYKIHRGEYKDYKSLFSLLLVNISELIYFVSYLVDFLIYYYFNKMFRTSFHYYLSKIF